MKRMDMNILVAVNEAYLQPLSVVLYSLQKHNHGAHVVYVLHFSIPLTVQKQFQMKMNRLCRGMKVVFCQVDEHRFDGIWWCERYRREAYLRLLMLSALPKQLDRILWLDADILVKGSLQVFYQYPDKGQCAVVCEDMIRGSERYEVLQQLGLRKEDRYFNSGVMLLLIKNIRKTFSEDFFFLWMLQNPDKLQFADQNVFNYCFHKKVVFANPEKYNVQLLKRQYSSAIKDRVYRKHAKIFHYNTKEKPWKNPYYGAEEAEYWRYAIRALGVQSFIKHYLEKCKK